MNAPRSQIAVMLCTCDGANFLHKQVESLAQQTVGSLLVFVSDDHSSDQTCEIIERSKVTFPNLNIHQLPHSDQIFPYNFLSIFKMQSPPASYFAYSDQDDLWEADKLARALQWLQTLPAGQPGLYGSRTRLIDDKDNEIGLSLLFTKKPSFANALAQNIFGGNTMVMNLAAWHLMQSALGQTIQSHDWWTYQVIAGAGGAIFYDPYPSVRYRQHANNFIGASNTFFARLIRLKTLLQGRVQRANDINVAALLNIKHLLTPENQCILEKFSYARQARFFARVRAFRQSKVYCQTTRGMLGLWIAVILGKL